MKTVLIIILIFVFSSFSIEFSDLNNCININSVNCEFYPCLINDSIINLNYASIKKYSPNEIIIECEKITYIWKNKSTLYKETKNLGCYQLLCITWNFGYDLIF